MKKKELFIIACFILSILILNSVVYAGAFDSFISLFKKITGQATEYDYNLNNNLNPFAENYARFQKEEPYDVSQKTISGTEEIKNYKGYIVEFETEPLSKIADNNFQRTHAGQAATVDQKSLLIYENRKILETISNYINSEKTESGTSVERIYSRGQINIEDPHLKTDYQEPKLVKEFHTLISGVVLNLTDEEAEKIKSVPGIKKIYPNYLVNITLIESVPLIQNGILAGQLDMDGNDCTISGKQCLTGQGIKIAIIDTGVDYTHPDLGGCTQEQFLSGTCEKVMGGYDFVNNDNNPIDDQGHGTHCTGIAAGNKILKGVAPDAKIYAYKVLDGSGSGPISNTISAIERSTDPNQDGDFSDRVDIISLSLGGPGNPDDPGSTAIDNAVNLGVVAVVAAGNSGPDTKTIRSPGTSRKAITVGAIDKNNIIAGFSSRGPVVWNDTNENINYFIKPDVVAPGVDICSSQSSNKPWNNKLCLDNNHVAISGTSMATPHVAGAVAILKQAHPDWTPDEIKASLKSNAIDLGYSLIEQGAGKIDLSKTITEENLEYIDPDYFYFDIESPKEGSFFKLNTENSIEFRGYFEKDYDSIKVEYLAEGDDNWRNKGIQILGNNNLIAKLDPSFLDKKGKYIFKISFISKGKEFSKTFNLYFFEELKFPIEITNCLELQKMGHEKDKEYIALSYKLKNDIDCSETTQWNNGIGFLAVDQIRDFNYISSFDGNGFVIKNLYCLETKDKPSLGYCGLFSVITEDVKLSNIKLLNVNISYFYAYVGGIVSVLNKGIIENSYVSGKINGDNHLVGGLVGYLGDATIINSSSDSEITGSDKNYESSQIGGIAGQSEGKIINCSVKGNITNYGKFIVGGLVGFNHRGEIENSYFEGVVTGNHDVGGLVGYAINSKISKSFSTGKVIGNNRVGGIIGFSDQNTDVSDCYSKSNLTLIAIPEIDYYTYIGGIIGINVYSNVFYSYFAGEISNPEKSIVGGLVGYNSRGEIKNSFWDKELLKVDSSSEGISKTTQEMKSYQTYKNAEWNFDIWDIQSEINDGYPYIKQIFSEFYDIEINCNCDSGVCCDGCNFKNSTAVCRETTDPCVKSYCTGINQDCSNISKTTPGCFNGQCSSTLNRCIRGTFKDITDTNSFALWNCSGILGGSTSNCGLQKTSFNCSYQRTLAWHNGNCVPSKCNSDQFLRCETRRTQSREICVKYSVTSCSLTPSCPRGYQTRNRINC